MNTIYKLFFIIFLSCLYSSQTGAEDWFYVHRVDDGDTIVLSDGRRIRYIGINAPEVEHKDQKTELYGNEAREYNTNLVYQKKVRLEFDKQKNDQYGRLLAYVFLKDGTFVNEKIIEEGYAFCLAIKPNIKYAEKLLQHQQKAMSYKKRIWQNLTKSGESYRGNKRSKKFHKFSCPYGKSIDKKHITRFQSKWDAFWAGFAPCKKCAGFTYKK